ncbi:AsmA family protein, partial [Balneolaceae bacterium ANBcel3]|nr:AsmA family protein [Balneolaceae bacterium ANBcel3]
MKKILYTLGVLLLLLLISIIGLSLYLTDDRLREMVLPEIREATGREVQVDRLSYSLLRTFPRFGLIIEGLEIPDPYEDQPARIQQVVVNVNLASLLRGEIQVQRLLIDQPNITFIVYEDGSTNFDDLMDDDPEPLDEPAGPMSLPDIDLSEIIVQEARFVYIDHTSNLSVELSGLSLTSSLRFGDVLESTLDLVLSQLNVTMDDSPLIRNLRMELHQVSVLDLEGEVLNLMDGRLVVHGLALTLDGSVSDWGEGEPMIDLNIASASDSFGTLLDLVPPEYESFIEGLDTDGGFELTLSLNGRITEDDIPSFEAVASITDGYIQHPDVPERISDIRLSAEADNRLITIHSFEARAGETGLSARGVIRNPLEEEADFDFDATIRADLGTIHRYVPIEEFDIESISGTARLRAEASGLIRDPEASSFDVSFELSEGSVKHRDLEHALEQITLRVSATQDEVVVPVFSAISAENRFTAEGRLTSPLQPEHSAFEAAAELEWNLETLPGYYPIDTDTLDVRGRIVLEGTAEGRLEH